MKIVEEEYAKLRKDTHNIIKKNVSGGGWSNKSVLYNKSRRKSLQKTNKKNKSNKKKSTFI